MKSFVLLLVVLLSPPVYSQSFSILSHYPSSGFVINRFLPFTVSGDDIQEVTEILIDAGKKDCLSLIDPSHKNTFHITCLEPSLVTAEIKVLDTSGETQSLLVNQLIVLRESEPGQTVDANFTEPGGEQ